MNIHFFSRLLLVLCFLSPAITVYSLSFFGFGAEQSSEQKIKQFSQMLEKSPTDAATHYNLGVAHYRSGNFVKAQKNFQSAVEHAGKDLALTQRGNFNLAASCLQHAQEILPEAWEKNEVSASTLEQAIAATKDSIQAFEAFVKNNPKDQKALAGLKYAQDLCKKLEEKLTKQQQDKQDQQDNKQDNQDQQNQQDNKDQKNQDQKNDKQNKKDQSKQDGQNKKDQQKNEDSQKGDDSKDEDEKEDESEKNDEEKSEDKEDVDKDKQEQDQGQERGDGESEPDTSDDQEAKGNDQKPDHANDENTKKSDTNKEHAHHPQPSETEGKQGGAEMQETENENVESMEMRGLRAMLESLQADESKTQKKLLQYQTGQHKEPSAHGQKPW